LLDGVVAVVCCGAAVVVAVVVVCCDTAGWPNATLATAARTSALKQGFA